MIEYIVISQLITVIISLFYFKKRDIEKIKYYVAGFSSLSALIAIHVFVSQISNPVFSYKHLYNFMIINRFYCSMGLLSDSLSITASCVSCIIAALVNFYSIGYISRNISLFLLYINAFSLFSTLFAASNNLLQMYICLTILSVILYFLIVLDSKQKSVNCGFKITFLHKFGDVCFIISMIAVFIIFGSLNFDEINKFSVQNDVQMDLIEITAILMLISIFIRSSQIGFASSVEYLSRLQIPASAIISSSVFFAFGMFVMIRLQSFFEFSDFVQNATIVFGAISAVYCAIKSAFSRNINKILLHATSSQVGLMIIACGFASYGSAIMLFVTHAFSKVLLFFSAGSVIRSLSGEKYIDKIGGLLELLPKTYVGFIMAALSTLCLPLLPYYYVQKILLNDILNSELSTYYIGLISIIITFILTNVYIFRTIYFIFYGKNKAEETVLAYLNENENFIINTIYLSVFFAIFSGVVFYYTSYSNVIWKDVFAFSLLNTNVTLLYSIINLCGISFAAIICKSIKSKELIPRFNFHDYNSNILRNFLDKIENIKFKKIINVDYNYYSENVIKPGASFICFVLIVFLFIAICNS